MPDKLLPTSTKRLPDKGFISRNLAMDGIRGLAVLIVFLSHTSGRGQALAPFLQLHGIGHIGVYLFFVLSGYLLADNLLNECERFGDVSIRNFLVRRFLRIAPLYYLVISAVFLFQLTSGLRYKSYLHIDNGWAGYVQHLLFWRGDGVFWTIPAEFTFYFALPLIVLTLIKYEKKAYYICIVLMALYGTWFLLIMFHEVSPKWSLRIVQIAHSSQFFDVFMCGVLAAFFRRLNKVKNFFLHKGETANLLALSLLVLIGAISCAAVAFKFLIFDRPFYGMRWFTLGYGIVFAFTILTAQTQGVIYKIFNQQWLCYMGRVGFSWYLIHLFVIQQVNHLQLVPPLLFLLSTMGCILLASVLFYLVEKPFIDWGRKITVRTGYSQSAGSITVKG